MFSVFKVPESQQDLLRFFWFRDNKPNQELVPYRSTSHLFGCSCSPAIANFALKYCASSYVSDETLNNSVEYLQHSFYVDDGVHSVDSPEEAIETLSGAIKILKKHNVRLHKIVGNNQQVMDYFPSSEIASASEKETRVLGVCWNTTDDNFSIESPTSLKPYTRRGILSFNKSFYDPIGFMSPLLLTGRIFQRKVLTPEKDSSDTPHQINWDEELPLVYKPEWDALTANLNSVNTFKVNRSFYPCNFKPEHQDMHIFSDASDMAIGYAVYIRSIDKDGHIIVNLVTASSKVSPRCATSIPRLELCAAVEAACASSRILEDLRVKPNHVSFYTDSNIVLGYLSNISKRFTKYVERRVAIIRDHTKTEDWHYVKTSENPADLASRPCYKVEDLLQSIWLHGPAFFHTGEKSIPTPDILELRRP